MAETGEILLWVMSSLVAVIAIASALYACSANSRKELVYRDGADATPFR